LPSVVLTTKFVVIDVPNEFLNTTTVVLSTQDMAVKYVPAGSVVVLVVVVVVVVPAQVDFPIIVPS
jgi:hypothetical protein